MNENALFYTFTTVAQTLAAALAVLAAFVVFRLPSIESVFRESYERFRSLTTTVDADELVETAQRSGRMEVDRRLRQAGVSIDAGISAQTVEAILGRADLVHAASLARRSALNDLAVAFLAGGVPIVASLLALPFVPLLKYSREASYGAVSIILMFSIASFYFDYRLIRRLVASGINRSREPHSSLVGVGAPSMSHETLRSTFAAVAQTLAAVLAILIAIVVIRLPALEADAARADLIMRAFDPFKSNYTLARKAFERNGVTGLKDAKFDFNADDPNMGMHLHAGHRAWKARRGLIPAIWLALIPTFAVIASCLIALPMVSLLADYPVRTRKLVLVVVGLAIGCLISYVYLIARLLDSRTV